MVRTVMAPASVNRDVLRMVNTSFVFRTRRNAERCDFVKSPHRHHGTQGSCKEGQVSTADQNVLKNSGSRHPDGTEPA